MKRKAGSSDADVKAEVNAAEEVAMVYGIEGKPPKVVTKRPRIAAGIRAHRLGTIC